jgi:protocatechuate 3,4-dioxygenase beta subunit
MNIDKNRRQFLKMGTGTFAGLLLATRATKAFASACGITPEQTSGPFYPGESQFHSGGGENDLTVIPGAKTRPLGQVVYVRGKVLNQACNPVQGALVEIWQACASGRYDNPKDTNTAPLDPNFKYWGEAYTDQNGEYSFKTIQPGAYPADVGWIRPPHVHFQVSKLGHHELITQLYFKGQSLNDVDQILLAVPAAERDSVIVDFQPSGPELEPGSLTGEFNITLQSVR